MTVFVVSGQISYKESTAIYCHHLFLHLSRFIAVSTVAFRDLLCFLLPVEKWGEWLKKVSPISINTQVLVENESKRPK